MIDFFTPTSLKDDPAGSLFKYLVLVLVLDDLRNGARNAFGTPFYMRSLLVLVLAFDELRFAFRSLLLRGQYLLLSALILGP